MQKMWDDCKGSFDLSGSAGVVRNKQLRPLNALKTNIKANTVERKVNDIATSRVDVNILALI